MLRWELLWDAPKLTGQRSGESGILTGRFGTSEQLKEGGLVEPRDSSFSYTGEGTREWD